MLIGLRNFERGESAAKDIGAAAISLLLDVTDRVSIAEAAGRIRKEFGRLDLLVQNAAISNTRKGSFSEWVPRSWPELTPQRGEGVGLHSAA